MTGRASESHRWELAVLYNGDARGASRDRPALATLSQAVAPHIGHRTSSRYTVAS